jgi:uridine phosphorylase
VLNELDALVNINFNTRLPHSDLRSLDIIRIGTSGALQPEIPVNSLLISSAAFGLDALMHYYKHELNQSDEQLLHEFRSTLPSNYKLYPYLVSASSKLIKQFGYMAPLGLTLTAPGFYSPQGRQVRAKSTMPDLLSVISSFRHSGKKITNLEMETAGIYGLSSCLGHHALSFNVILANRATNKFSKKPAAIMDGFIQTILNALTS